MKPLFLHAIARANFKICIERISRVYPIRLGVLLALALSNSPSVLAQVQNLEQAAQEGLRRQEERTREQQQSIEPKADELHPAAPLTANTQLPAESPCFLISDLLIEGPDAWRFAWLHASFAPFSDQCVGVQGVRQIAAALDEALITQGYATTRVSLPAQNLKDGTLRVVLHTGRIAALRMVEPGQDAKPDAAWGTWWNAFPTHSGALLNIRDLEQGVEQMKRLPSQEVATRIEPGAEPDTSVVLIERRAASLRERLRGGITLDNSGSMNVGRTVLSAYGAFDNPLGLNDVFNISGNTNAERPNASHRSQSASLAYSIPFGYSTFSISASHNRFAQYVQGTTVRFLSSGDSDTAEGRWQYTAWRSASSKLGFYAALSTRRAHSYLDDVELIVQRRRTTNIEAGVNGKHLIGNGGLEYELGYRRGADWFRAQDDLPTDGAGGITLRPRIWTFSASFNQSFRVAQIPWRYSAILRGQQTSDATSSVDQFSIGGRASVRGFDGDNVLLAESGYFVRNELATPLPQVAGIDCSAYLGADIGRVWGPSAQYLVGNKLAGMVIGTRAQWKSLQFDIALATPLAKPDNFKTQRWNPYLAATYAF
ncbi:MAG: ShlB/FhaC/HecB family hemolysin secretion/activation protein [Betaproteobacteria bacterium]|nr:ShlB/FhaC/HecB family hemolysin secretion/activation protein [Betaproteobacteria bacterium]